MEKIPDSAKNPKIEAYLFGLRLLYQRQIDLIETVALDWQKSQSLEGFEELGYYNDLTTLLCEQIEASQSFQVYQKHDLGVG